MLGASDFTWNEFWWEAEVDLADHRVARARVPLVFAPEGREEGPLTTDEFATLNAVVSSISATVDTAVRGVHGAYPELRKAYGEAGVSMPSVGCLDDLCDLIEVSSLNVHPLTRDGHPYVGVAFDAQWDPEHGAGVLVHGTRVVEVGGVDTAILLWIAERDANERE